MTILHRTRCLAWVLMLFSALAGAALAQPTSFDGRWRAAFTGESGKPRTGTVVLQGTTGTWDMDTWSRNNPCVGKAVPVAVKQGSGEVMISIERSKVLASCPDTTMRLRVASDGTLVGSFKGSPFVLSRVAASPVSAHAAAQVTNSESAQSGASKRIQMLYFGGNDCPPCVVWRGLELPKLQKMAVFQTVEFVYVTKSIASPIPSVLFLPDVAKPYKAQLDIAGGGNQGSSQTAILVDGQVFDYYSGARSADEIEARLLAIRAGGIYPFERCVKRRPGNSAQCDKPTAPT